MADDGSMGKTDHKYTYDFALQTYVHKVSTTVIEMIEANFMYYYST